MRIKLETLSDFARHNYKVRVTCQTGGCGRMVDHNASQFAIDCAKKGYPARVSELEPRLTCGWCMKRNAKIGPA